MSNLKENTEPASPVATQDDTWTEASPASQKEEFLPALAPRWFLALAALLMLCSATFDTVSTKAANRQKLPKCDGCDATYFEAPMLQTFSGYIGEFIFLPLYFLDRWIAQKRNSSPKLDLPSSPNDFRKPHCPVWMWIFPLLLDFASTTCLNYSTMLAQVSTVQMLRNSSIILAFLLSAFALKNRIYMHQVFGVLLVLVGVVLVSVYAILNGDSETNYHGLQWLGIATALGGTVLSTLQWVTEEYIFRHYYCSPFEGVGWMGLYGMVIGGAALGIVQATGLEDLTGAFYQMGLGEPESRNIIGFSVGYIFSLAVNTASGITVTKLSSSLLRTIVNACRTVTIWLIEVIIGWAAFAVLNTIGLVVITIAVCVYNYNYFTKKRDHWFGDTLMRKPAACLPNRHEVTETTYSTEVELKKEKSIPLRRRINSTPADHSIDAGM